MNYNSQLKGWAFDRATEYWRSQEKKGSLDELFADALLITQFGYVADSDFKDACSRIMHYLQESEGALEKIDQLNAELLLIREQIEVRGKMQ